MEFRKVALFSFPFFLQINKRLQFYMKPVEVVLEAIASNYCGNGQACMETTMDGFLQKRDSTLAQMEKNDNQLVPFQQGGDTQPKAKTKSRRRICTRGGLREDRRTKRRGAGKRKRFVGIMRKVLRMNPQI